MNAGSSSSGGSGSCSRRGRRWRWLARWALAIPLALSLALLPALGTAVDNPDSTDRAAAFASQVRPLEERLGATSGGRASTEQGQALAVFLEAEMNRAYNDALPQLSPAARQALVAAQRQWQRFRDAELAFARQQWTMASTGSSHTLARAQHRAALLKARIRDLHALLAAYPAEAVAGKR